MTWEQFEGQLDNPVMEASTTMGSPAGMKHVVVMICPLFPSGYRKFEGSFRQAYFRSLDLSISEARSGFLGRELHQAVPLYF